MESKTVKLSIRADGREISNKYDNGIDMRSIKDKAEQQSLNKQKKIDIFAIYECLCKVFGERHLTYERCMEITKDGYSYIHINIRNEDGDYDIYKQIKHLRDKDLCVALRCSFHTCAFRRKHA